MLFSNAEMDCINKNLIFCINCLNAEEIPLQWLQIRIHDGRQVFLSMHREACNQKMIKISSFYKPHTSSEIEINIAQKNFIDKFKLV